MRNEEEQERTGRIREFKGTSNSVVLDSGESALAACALGLRLRSPLALLALASRASTVESCFVSSELDVKSKRPPPSVSLSAGFFHDSQEQLAAGFCSLR